MDLANLTRDQRHALWQEYQTAEREDSWERWDDYYGRLVTVYRFTCKRCKRFTSGEDGGGDDFPGLCSKCWCAVHPHLALEQLTLTFGEHQ